MSALKEWETFYVIIGSSAAALIGLQFVVIALIADIRMPSSTREIDAFATPTIVHFGVVLLVSGIISAPWRAPLMPRVLFGILGGIGLGYACLVGWRARQQTNYQVVLEDWLFHVVLPAVAYALLGATAFALGARLEGALFAVAAASFLLLFIGIHNAWDTVTYMVVVGRERAASTHGTQSGPGTQDR